jgi:hypothetical protein
MKLNKLLLLFLISNILLFSISINADKQNTIILTVNNSFSIGTEIEVKCDWMWQEKQYKYYNVFTVKGHSNEKIKVPSNMKQCEVWVLKVIYW